ncbi:MAG: M20/M25/M40 family metallo-hydrolase [Crocinitomicaceae bacterium]|nr:M20/M25/M40 family metallo-hydrolase [Crocinitomicaceae bacterium]
MELLKSMCAVHAPAGNEVEMKEFILNYLKSNESSFTVKPEVISGNEIQDCIILKFGKPRTAIFAHMDSIGFTVRYGKQLIKLGGPRTNEGTELIGTDSNGFIDTELLVIEDDSGQTTLEYIADRELDRGTELVFKPNWREDDHFVQCCYMDNRLGCYSALKVAETLENGIICFSCWEETGGGSVGYLGKYIYENYGVQQALISDITWKTEGVHHGKGVAISIRDSGIPRRSYINTILNLARKSEIPFQIEVESSGGSDGNALQKSPYPFDWCFIGAPEDHVHTANEKVHKKDIEAMIEMYKYLMAYL